MNYIYKKISEKDVNQVYNLLLETFNEFIYSDFLEEGRNRFYEYIDKLTILSHIKDKKYFHYVAKINNKVVGYIEISNNNHVCILFVNKEYYKQGIGRELFLKALKQIKKQDSEIKEIDVHATLYGINFYKKLGFIPTNVEQIKDGCRYVPMIIKI